MAILACPSISPRFVPLTASVGAPFPVSLAPRHPDDKPERAIQRGSVSVWTMPQWTPASRLASPGARAESTPVIPPVVEPVRLPVIQPARVEIVFDDALSPYQDQDDGETVAEMRERFDAELAAYRQFEAMYLEALRRRAQAEYDSYPNRFISIALEAD